MDFLIASISSKSFFNSGNCTGDFLGEIENAFAVRECQGDLGKLLDQEKFITASRDEAVVWCSN